MYFTQAQPCTNFFRAAVLSVLTNIHVDVHRRPSNDKFRRRRGTNLPTDLAHCFLIALIDT